MTRLGGVLVVAALVTAGCSSPEKPRPALDVATARLVVASTVAAATFYPEAYAEDQGS